MILRAKAFSTRASCEPWPSGDAHLDRRTNCALRSDLSVTGTRPTAPEPPHRTVTKNPNHDHERSWRRRGLFSDFVEAICQDPAQGRTSALAAVSAVSGDDEAAELVVRIGCAISRADGAFTESEKAQVAEIAASLGIETPAID